MICEHCGAHMDYRADYLEWRCPNCGSTHDMLDDTPAYVDDFTEDEKLAVHYPLEYGDEELTAWERDYEAWWLEGQEDSE